jgi:uncharacterized protein YjbI with pentapeptide repeats
MANPRHLRILRRGPLAWNEWRSQSRITPDLVGLDLRELRLLIDGRRLRGTDFPNLLSFLDLSWARMEKSNLVGAHLHNTTFDCTELVGVNFGGSFLDSTLFKHADLEGADFTGATLANACFLDVDLSQATGLEKVRHIGPSIIGVDSISRSKGLIPDVFLRGCGVPEPFIVYARSLVANPIEFYSCFISYSTRDQNFADRLYADLQAKGVRCWFAPHDMKSGRKIHEQIDEAIRLYDRLLLILSPASIESEWVRTEIAKARKREVRDRCRVLFPIRLVSFETLRDWECFDADTGKDSAREIREYYIPDFSNWKTDHDAYQRELAKLIASLNSKVDATHAGGGA